MPLMTFAEALDRVIHSRGLSRTAASSMLGFKSKTAFFRILNGESKIQSEEKCLQAAIDCAALALTPQEIALLRTGLEVSRQGRDGYAVQSVLREMLQGTCDMTESGGAVQPVALLGGVAEHTLEALLARMSYAGRVGVTLLGRAELPVMRWLGRFARMGRLRSIRHYVALSGDPQDLAALSCASPLFFWRGYEAYAAQEEQQMDGYIHWLLRSGTILLTVEEEAPSCMMLTCAQGGYWGMEDPQGLALVYLRNYLKVLGERVTPLKADASAWAGEAFQLENYLNFTRQIQAKERAREIATLKPDVPIMCVPPSILLAATQAGLSQGVRTTRDETVMRRLIDVHTMRYTNLYNKRKPTHIVCSAPAMFTFARTGRRSDHFFLARAYTPAERETILRDLLHQATHNPRFHLWFQREDAAVPIKREATSYEGIGLVLIKARTSWRLEEDHEEVFFANPQLAGSFCTYLTTELVPNAVQPQQQTEALLHAMIEEARNHA